MAMIKIGAVGGRGGSIWEEKADELVGIFVSYDKDVVYSLQFLNYVNGELHMSVKYGTDYYEMNDAIVLDYPSEFITSISGSFERINKKSTDLRSIKFCTNKGSYGPFGTPSTDGKENIHFNFVIGNHQFFGGFHGTQNSNGFIRSIGFYVKDVPSSVIKIKDSPVKVKEEK
ncbi:protein RESTRICTED TEV MOVEMENT 1-like [Solanum pennellii]|uniref:Protein RESTRICTED TEV MOVEMENT 1-like n=1 Tax=Solanum pennellii TaxID=28526 RepID=A0ABM1HMC1_SOLPN|nr:protein RESTRICTED TEV MOVEMENT 1-like [Solanum pennellii]